MTRMSVPRAPAVASSGRWPGSRQWLVVALLLALMVVSYADKAVLGLAAKPLMHDLHLSPAQYGSIASAFYLLYSVSAIAVGFLSNRVATKWVLLVLAVIWSVVQLPMLGAAGIGVLMTTRIILGAAEGPANPVAMHATHKWFANEQRSLPSSLLNVGAGLGLAIAAPLLSLVISRFGWRAAFFALFVVGIVWAVVWALLGREGQVAGTSSVKGETATAAEEPSVAYRRILLSGTWLGSFAAAFAGYWTVTLTLAWLPPYLQTIGYSTATTGTLVMVPALAMSGLMIAQGLLTQWLMRRGVSSRLARGVLGGVTVLVAGATMTVFAVVPNGPVKIVLMALAFSLGGVSLAIGQTVTAEITPTRQRGGVLATTAGIVTTAGLLAPAITGKLVGSGSTQTAGYSIAFLVAGALMLVGGLLAVFFVRPERDAQRLGLSTSTIHKGEIIVD